MFTGDRSGEFLYRALWETGFANQPQSLSRDDGLQLRDAYITAPVRCVPPDNKPLRDEILNCRPFLVRELALLRNVKVVVALGGIGLNAYLSVLQDAGKIKSRAAFRFGHGAEYQQAKTEQLYNSISNYYARQATKYADGTIPIELQAIRIGDNVFVGVPGEVFVEIGLRLKRLGSPRTFVSGVTNGYIGYLPTRKAYEAGGYEVVSSRCSPEVEDRLVEGVEQLQGMLGLRRG